MRQPIEIQVMDALKHDQNSLAKQFSKKQAEAADRIIYVYGQIINTLANQGANLSGLCYVCHRQIESPSKVAVYRSLRNQSISLFHEVCWVSLPPVAGSGKPLIVQV